MMRLAPGTLVSQNVVLVRPLGEGGMGAIWVGEHVGLHIQVAVKFVTEALANNESVKSRFALEAKASAQIKSPHVVQVFDHGTTDDGIPYIVMELLEGQDLGDRIKERGPLTLAETATVVQQTCKALSRAHALGIVHRDIKPSNIFIADVEGELFVKVLDFGIAKMTANDPAGGVTSSGMMVGTPWYMSPEQIVSSKHVDFRADLWSVAVVAYHALTGQVPFDGDTLGAICIAINNGAFSYPRSLRAGLPAGVDAWFQKGLAPAPEARFASARALADALVQVADGRAMQPSPETQPQTHVRMPAADTASEATTQRSNGLTPPEQVAPTMLSQPRMIDPPPTLDGTSGATHPVGRKMGPIVALVVALAIVGGALVGLVTFVVVRKPTSNVTIATPPPPPSASAAVPIVPASASNATSVVGMPSAFPSAIATAPIASAGPAGTGARKAPGSGKNNGKSTPSTPSAGDGKQVDRGF